MLRDQVKESEFQTQVIAMAERFGWQVWHVPAPMVWRAKDQKFVPSPQGAGLPDLILLHDDPPRLVFMELKADGGKLSERQREFLLAAREVAEWSIEHEPHTSGTSGATTIGVFACWPDQIDHIEQMLRSRVVA
jgi:hypothetical protein